MKIKLLQQKKIVINLKRKTKQGIKITRKNQQYKQNNNNNNNNNREYRKII